LSGVYEKKRKTKERRPIELFIVYTLHIDSYATTPLSTVSRVNIIQKDTYIDSCTSNNTKYV